MGTLGPSTSSFNPPSQNSSQTGIAEESEAGSPTSRESYPIWMAMQPDDLFDISMCSDESKKQIPTLQYGITRLEFNDGQFRVFVANRFLDTEETKIELGINQSYFSTKIRRFTNIFRGGTLPMVRNRKINGVNYEIYREKFNQSDYESEWFHDGSRDRCINFRKEFTIHTQDISTTFKDLLHHLFFVFPNPNHLLSLDLRGIRTENFDISMDLLDNYEQCLRCQCISIKILNHEFVDQTNRILEKMVDLKNLKLDVAVNGLGFFNEKMCNMNHLYISYTKNYFSTENLLSLINCETIKLWAVTIGASSLNQFIKKWLESNSRKFHFLEMPCFSFYENDNNPENIWKDLDRRRCRENQRESIYKIYEWNYDFNCQGKHRFIKCHSGWDIERSDGVLATIVYTESLFYFLVWLDRYPEQPFDHIEFVDADE